MENKEARKCDRCDKPGMWHLRANTLFLCNKCKDKLEWGTDE